MRKVSMGVGVTLIVGALLLLLVHGQADKTAGKSRQVSNAYIKAREVEQHSFQDNMSVARRAAKHEVATLAKGCRGVLRDAPPEKGLVRENPNSIRVNTRDMLLLEVLDGLGRSITVHRAVGIREFASAVDGLRWNNTSLADAIHLLTKLEEEETRSPTVYACREIRLWARSGFKIVPSEGSVSGPGNYTIHQELWSALAKLGCEAAFPGSGILQVLVSRGITPNGGGERRVQLLEAKVEAEDNAIMARALAEDERVLGITRIRVDHPAKKRIARGKESGMACIEPRVGRRSG